MPIFPGSPGLQGGLPALDTQQEQFQLMNSLPKVECPTFSGVLSEWGLIKDIYEQMVHKLQIPANYKYYYLINALRGEAAEKIKKIPVVGENYITAWDTLVNYNENERRLVSQQVNDLMSIKPMKSESFSEIKRI